MDIMADHRENSPLNNNNQRTISNIFYPAVLGFDINHSPVRTAFSISEHRSRSESSPALISTQTISELANEVPTQRQNRVEPEPLFEDDGVNQGSVLTESNVGQLESDDFQWHGFSDTHSEQSSSRRESTEASQETVNNMVPSQTEDETSHLTDDLERLRGAVQNAQNGIGGVDLSDGSWGSDFHALFLLQHCVYLLSSREMASEERQETNGELFRNVIPLNVVFADEGPAERAAYESAIRHMAVLIERLDRLPERSFDASNPETPETPWSNPAAEQFLENLPSVSIEDISEDNRNCPICQDPYVEDDSLDEPFHHVVILPSCGHTFGWKCIKTWLDPQQNPPRSTCPLCRMVLFEIPWSEEVVLEPADEEHANGDEENDNEEGLGEAPTDWDADSFLEAIHEVAVPPRYDEDRDEPDDDPPTPGIYLTSSQILRLFGRFTRGTGPNRLVIAQALATEMGDLVQRVEPVLTRLRTPRPWENEGPPIHYVMDPAMAGMFEIVLEKLRDMEEVLVWSLDLHDFDEHTDQPVGEFGQRAAGEAGEAGEGHADVMD